VNQGISDTVWSLECIVVGCMRLESKKLYLIRLSLARTIFTFPPPKSCDSASLFSSAPPETASPFPAIYGTNEKHPAEKINIPHSIQSAGLFRASIAEPQFGGESSFIQ